MKEFIRTLKQIFQVHGSDTLAYTVIPIGGGIIGVILVLIIMAIDGTGEDYGMIGTMLAIMFGAIEIFFGLIFTLQGEFNLAVSMGKARKYYVSAKYANLVLTVLLVEVVIVAFTYLEKALYPAIYPGAVCELSFSFLADNPGLIVGIAIVVPVIIMFLGVMLMRFSTKFFWVLWALWMFGCMGLPRISHAMTEKPDSWIGRMGWAVANFIDKSSTAGLAGVAAVVAVVVMAVTYWLFKKQRVTA